MQGTNLFQFHSFPIFERKNNNKYTVVCLFSKCISAFANKHAVDAVEGGNVNFNICARLLLACDLLFGQMYLSIFKWIFANCKLNYVEVEWKFAHRKWTQQWKKQKKKYKLRGSSQQQANWMLCKYLLHLLLHHKYCVTWKKLFKNLTKTIRHTWADSKLVYQAMAAKCLPNIRNFLRWQIEWRKLVCGESLMEWKGIKSKI